MLAPIHNNGQAPLTPGGTDPPPRNPLDAASDCHTAAHNNNRGDDDDDQGKTPRRSISIHGIQVYTLEEAAASFITPTLGTCA